MGQADRERHHLQKVARLRAISSLVGVLTLLLSPRAQAQIAPFHEMIEFSASRDGGPALTVRAKNGSPAYSMKLVSYGGRDDALSYIELLLQRPNSKPDAPNALEPEYRWHGIQAYDFVASDFALGPEHAGLGPTRHIQIKRRKLDVTFSVIRATVHHVDRPAPADYDFDDLALDVVITNMP